MCIFYIFIFVYAMLRNFVLALNEFIADRYSSNHSVFWVCVWVLQGTPHSYFSNSIFCTTYDSHLIQFL